MLSIVEADIGQLKLLFSLYKKIDSTNLENTLLKNQQNKLVSEKSDLIKKNESAKSQLKSLLDRIDSMKNHGKE